MFLYFISTSTVCSFIQWYILNVFISKTLSLLYVFSAPSGFQIINFLCLEWKFLFKDASFETKKMSRAYFRLPSVTYVTVLKGIENNQLITWNNIQKRRKTFPCVPYGATSSLLHGCENSNFIFECMMKTIFYEWAEWMSE